MTAIWKIWSELHWTLTPTGWGKLLFGTNFKLWPNISLQWNTISTIEKNFVNPHGLPFMPFSLSSSIYRPWKDKRLSWHSWLTYSGRLTHISGHPSAAVERGTGKVRWSKTNVLPLCNARLFQTGLGLTYGTDGRALLVVQCHWITSYDTWPQLLFPLMLHISAATQRFLSDFSCRQRAVA